MVIGKWRGGVRYSLSGVECVIPRRPGLVVGAEIVQSGWGGAPGRGRALLLLLFLYDVVVAVLALYGSITTRRKYKRNIQYGLQGTGIPCTHYTSRMGTARVKQEVGADTSVIAIEK